MHSTTTPGPHGDQPILFPSPAGGACWPPRRCSVPLGLVAAEAMDAGDTGHHVHQAYSTGHDLGEQQGFRAGWAWGLVCGIVATIGIVGAIFAVAAVAGAATASSAPTQQSRPVVQA